MLGCAPPSLMLLLMCVMPETPRFLLTQHRRQEAMAALRFLWGSEQGWEDPPIGAEQVRGWEAELTGVGQQSREGSTACSQGHTLGGQGGACPPSTLSEDSPSASCLRARQDSWNPTELGPSLRSHQQRPSFDPFCLRKRMARPGGGYRGRAEDLDLTREL